MFKCLCLCPVYSKRITYLVYLNHNNKTPCSICCFKLLQNSESTFNLIYMENSKLTSDVSLQCSQLVEGSNNVASGAETAYEEGGQLTPLLKKKYCFVLSKICVKHSCMDNVVSRGFAYLHYTKKIILTPQK